MMGYAFLLRTFLLRSARYFPKKGMSSSYPGSVFRYTYGDYYKGGVHVVIGKILYR